MVIGDSPYGVTDENWDKAWTKSDLTLILKQVAAQNAAQEWAACFFHEPRQTEMFLDVLDDNRYKEPVHLYWHKLDHASQTPVNQFTSSVEKAILAFYPSRQKCTVNLATNPKHRHNFFECPQVTKKYKDSTGRIANPCQKPSDVSAWVIGSVCMPGSTVLVIGPGAGGGEVLGALFKGCNVVAVEKDEYQFTQLQSHLLQVKDAIRKAESIPAKEPKDDGSSSLSQSFPPGSQYQPPNDAEEKVEKILKCISCGQEIKEGAVQCTSLDCEGTDTWFCVQCTVVVEGAIVCRDCKRHADEESASQAETQEQD